MPLRACAPLGCSYAKFDERGFSGNDELGLRCEIRFLAGGGGGPAWLSGSSIVSSASVHKMVVINKAKLSQGLDLE